MTQPASESSTRPPMGFAAPAAQPLATLNPGGRCLDVPGPGPAPAEFSPPEDPGPSLASVRPQPGEHRDPNAPFEVSSDPSFTPNAPRDPRQPMLTLSNQELRALTGFPAPVGPPALPDYQPNHWTPGQMPPMPQRGR